MMRILLANRQTEDQKRANEFVRYQFILGMMNMDERMIHSLLKKDSRFMGNLNSWQFANWLAKQFATLKTSLFNSEFNDRISLDIYPGSETFEFSFSSINPNCLNEDPFTTPQYDSKQFSKKEILVIRLVLLFENGEISDIRVPKKTLCHKKIKKFQIEN